MPFGQTGPGPDMPQYDPLATLLAGYGSATPAAATPGVVPPAAAAPVAAAPQTSAAVAPPPTAAPQMAAAPQAQPQQAPAAQAASTQPAIMLPPPPSAPTFDGTKMDALVAKKAADGPKQVAPKWWERLAGAATGFGAGYSSGNAAEGVRLGSAITTRGQDAENVAAGNRIAGDDAQIKGLKDKFDIDTKAYEGQYKQFGQQREVANDQRQQGNEDRTFQAGRTDAANSQANSDRTFQAGRQDADEKSDEFNQTNTRETGRDAETSRHNKATEAHEGASLAETRRHNQQTETEDGPGGSKGPTANDRVRGQNLNKLDATRQQEYRNEENGDPKANDPQGFNDKLKSIYKKPLTSSYTKKDQDEEVAELNAQHNRVKGQIEDQYAQGVNNLGGSAVPVQYDDQGHALNNSDGSPAGQRQAPPAAAPPAAAPPQKRESQPAAKPVQPQGGAAPPASLLKEGVHTTFKGGKGTWTLQNGKPVQVSK